MKDFIEGVERFAELLPENEEWLNAAMYFEFGRHIQSLLVEHIDPKKYLEDGREVLANLLGECEDKRLIALYNDGLELQQKILEWWLNFITRALEESVKASEAYRQKTGKEVTELYFKIMGIQSLPGEMVACNLRIKINGEPTYNCGT